MIRSIALGLVLLVAFAGCGWFAAGASPASSPTASPMAAPTANPPASPSSPAVTTPTPSAAATEPEPSPALPPDAIITLPDGVTHAGTLGTFTLDDHGTDTPWLPASTLPQVAVGADSEVNVQFADGTPIGFWQAIYAAADDLVGDVTVGLGERAAESPPLDAVTFPAPPSGEWVVSVRLRFADGRGDATYYWYLAVT